MKFRFLRDHLARTYRISMCCRELGVSRSGYYRWLKQPVPVRTLRTMALAEEVRVEFSRWRGICGARRIHALLAQRGIHAHVQTVARIMRSLNLRSRMCRKFKPRTTQSKHAHPPAPDRVQRDFKADGPNRLWIADITYVPTTEGFLYLSTVMDVWSRSIVGWSMADTLHATGPIDALRMAIRTRCPSAAGGLVHHSDRGVQYACHAYRGVLSAHGIEQSMSHAHDCYDNAMAESLFATLKKELTHHDTYATRTAARRAVFDWIEVWYQRARPHSALGYVSPTRFEAARRMAG